MGISGISSAEALKRLAEGNQRYVVGNTAHPNQTIDRRKEVVGGQNPFAVVLTCSDSRVPPEILFDQGIGDLFVIRNAGNILDDIVIGSIEYAVEHLGVKLVVVLGHQFCGAVTAASQGGEAPGHIHSVVEAIQPAVEKAKGQAGDLVVNAIRANVDLVTDQLASSEPIMAEFVKGHGLKVVGAIYNLETGAVEVFD